MKGEEGEQLANLNARTDQTGRIRKTQSWRSQISNKRIYILALIEKSLIFSVYAAVESQIGFFLDIFCNKNNFNCSKDTKQASMSVMSSITFFTSTLTYIMYPFIFKLNPKTTINLAKLGLAFSILIFCFGPFWALFVGRTLMGIFVEFCHVVAHWMIYQVALPQHKEFAVASILVVGTAVSLALTLLSYVDTGGWWMWRLVNSAPAILLIALVFIDMSVLKNVNGLDFLQSTMHKDVVVKQLSTYYEKATSIEILKLFNKKRETQTKKKIVGEGTKQSLWSEMKLHDKELINSTLVAVFGVGCFSDVFFYNGIYIGSHSLNNKEDVKASKEILFVGGVAYFIGSLLLMLFKFNKKRKTLIMVSQLIAILSFCLAAFGYLVDQLWIARMAIVPGCVFFGYIRVTTYLYIVDVCIPSLISIPLLFLRLSLAIILLVFPLVINFENSTKEQVGRRLIGVALFGFLCLVMTSIFMIETDGLSKVEISNRLRGLPIQEDNKGLGLIESDERVDRKQEEDLFEELQELGK